MSRLGELIAELCPDGVEYKRIADCVLPVNNIKWNEDTEVYKYIDLASVDRDTHSITETISIDSSNAPSRAQQIVHTNDILLGTTRPMLKRYYLVTDEYNNQICSTGFCVLRANPSIVLPNWLYHIIASSNFFNHVERYQKGASYPAISDAEVKMYSFPVPPLPVQREIVRILDNFTLLTAELTEELTAELTARKKQYNYYASQMLSGVEHKYHMVELGSLATFVYGFTDKAKDVGDVRFIRITDILDNGTLNPIDAKYISSSPESQKYLLKTGDILVARTGATYGKTLYITDNTPSVFASFLIKIQLDNSTLLNRFYWHFAQSSLYWDQANKLVSIGGQPQFNTGAISRIKVPIPSIQEQEHITQLLDKFAAIGSNINDGLPAEIAARQKQYEFFRDKLLTF